MRLGKQLAHDAMIRTSQNSPRTVYADYQASAPVDTRVVEVMRKYNEVYYANPHASEHAMGWQAAEAIQKARTEIASCFGGDSEEVIFTSGATEANNLAVLGLAARAPATRRRIVVSAIEHKCILQAAELAARRFGCVLERLSVDMDGQISLEELAQKLTDDVLLVSVMAVHNEVGTVAPIVQIAEMCAEVGAIFHTDAAQALPAGAINLNALPMGMASLSGHKIYGPKGIGALLVPVELQDRLEPIIVGGGQQNGLRAGTLPLPLCVGLAEAVRLMCGEEAGLDRIRVSNLRNRFAAELLATGKAELNGPSLSSRHPGNCNVRFNGWDAADLLGRLQPTLAASTGSACTSGSPEPSYVLRAMGYSIDEAASSVRFSFGRFTTEADIDIGLSEILGIIAVLPVA